MTTIKSPTKVTFDKDFILTRDGSTESAIKKADELAAIKLQSPTPSPLGSPSATGVFDKGFEFGSDKEPKYVSKAPPQIDTGNRSLQKPRAPDVGKRSSMSPNKGHRTALDPAQPNFGPPQLNRASGSVSSSQSNQSPYQSPGSIQDHKKIIHHKVQGHRAENSGRSKGSSVEPPSHSDFLGNSPLAASPGPVATAKGWKDSPTNAYKNPHHGEEDGSTNFLPGSLNDDDYAEYEKFLGMGMHNSYGFADQELMKEEE